MKTLEPTIIWTGDGFGASDAITLRQIKRDGLVYVYERIKKSGIHDGYEVFTVKVIEAGSPMPGGGTVAETYESYPRANAFGRTAWHLRGMPLVEQRFQELLTKQNALAEDDEEAAVTLSVPVVEFTCGELAETNSITYAEAQCFIKENIDKTIKLIRTGRKEGQTRGKPSNFYVKI